MDYVEDKSEFTCTFKAPDAELSITGDGKLTTTPNNATATHSWAAKPGSTKGRNTTVPRPRPKEKKQDLERENSAEFPRLRQHSTLTRQPRSVFTVIDLLRVCLKLWTNHLPEEAIRNSHPS